MSSHSAKAAQQDTNIKVPLISKIAYGMGDVGCNFSWMFVGNFLMIFYTDVCGISMAAVSLLMLVSRFWDAINDPVIGSLSDHTRTRWGRYRPWLLLGAPFTAVVLVLTFWAHPTWSNGAKSLYMYVTYCVLVLGYTCVNIPYGTLCGTLTQNIEERAKINTSRSVCAMIAINIINIITLPLISRFGGDNAARGYLLVTVAVRRYLHALSLVLFCQDERGRATAQARKRVPENAVPRGGAESAVSDCIDRSVPVRRDAVRTQRRFALLFQVCRGQRKSVHGVLHDFNYSVYSGCGRVSVRV